MPILNRDKTTIFGLKSQLTELEGKIQELFDNGRLTEDDRGILDLLSATQAIDLDLAVTKDRLASNIADLESDTLAASVTAIREYVIGALQLGGPNSTIESLQVLNSKISLSHRPHSGLGSIANFGTVKYEQDGDVHFFKLTATADPYRFLIDTKGLDINGYTVQVQYLYHYDPRELNDLIGNMILEGLTLVTP